MDPFASSLVELLPELVRNARQLERGADGAEDLAHDTVERALRFRDSYRDGSNLRAWLFRIQANLFFSKKRREGVARRARENLRVDPTSWGMESTQLVTSELSPPVRAAFSELPERLGRVLELVDMSDFSYKDAAEVLEVPVGTIMSRLHRGRHRLKERLQDHEARPALEEGAPDPHAAPREERRRRLAA